jgi:YVTN family beta-propeller protein
MEMARIVTLAMAAALAMVLGVAQSQAQNAYISNVVGTVSVIATASNTPTATLSLPNSTPFGVAVAPTGSVVYVTNFLADTVSVIDTATNMVVATIPVGTTPLGVAVTADNSRVYVVNLGVNSNAPGTVSVIDTATNTVVNTYTVGHSPYGVAVAPTGETGYVTSGDNNSVYLIPTNIVAGNVIIPVGLDPAGIAVTSDGSKVYVANQGSSDVSVIDTATNKVTATVTDSSFSDPIGIAVTPDGSKVYVSNNYTNIVSVIDTGTNKVTGTVTVGNNPIGVAVTPNGNEVYVANAGSNTVSVIATANNTVTATVPVGTNPKAFGKFIGPALPAQTLTVAENGSGSGQVTSSPAGIDCSPSSNHCAASFAGTTTVTLTASAAGGSLFSGWGGGCSGAETCAIDLTANTAVTASFITRHFTLRVSTTGLGTVKSSPAGIDCGKTCSASFAAETEVRLTAIPDKGWKFHEWGAACKGKNEDDCHVTMRAAESVMATFKEK